MNEILRHLPKVDNLLKHKELARIPQSLRKKLVTKFIDKTRNEILESQILSINETIIVNTILKEFENITKSPIKKVINATGITIHTNLGRSPIDKDILKEAANNALAFCNLEYDLEKGMRGDRYSHLDVFSEYLFHGYEILLVNNNAAAVFLILNTFAKNKECIVSRGELVEIGGGFRIPEVMANSGAILKEVGTTNKTKAKDYENAISENSAVIMKVHQSNFSIEGFCEDVDTANIASLAKENSLISYYDLGSGMISKFANARKEIDISKICESGLDIISFSMDKLLGGIQGGLILAKKEYVKELKQNQLLRMLRADKLSIALAYETLKQYMLDEQNSICAFEMLNASVATLKEKTAKLTTLLNKNVPYDEIITTVYAGGGSMPNEHFASFGIALSYKKPIKLEEYLRKNLIIARIENELVILDSRTLFEEDFEFIADTINKFFKE